jgi:hypothetical protein
MPGHSGTSRCLKYLGRADMLCPTSNRRFVPLPEVSLELAG